MTDLQQKNAVIHRKDTIIQNNEADFHRKCFRNENGC